MLKYHPFDCGGQPIVIYTQYTKDKNGQILLPVFPRTRVVVFYCSTCGWRYVLI
jgi:hypothetical protein